MDDMPDLSHLTPEERAIIEGVIMRQRQEEQREHEIMRRKQDEVAVLEQSIRERNEIQRAAGVRLESTCHICLKTKFADGVGHACHYCMVRCCARCGGKVTMRSNKVIWVCILCRKKQELLSKTGQWIHKSAGQDSMLWRMESDLRALPPSGDISLDKRPKLERAHSAAEKENLPLQRSGSALRRQYSQQETRCYGELEGPTRAYPHVVHPRQKVGYGIEDPDMIPLPPQVTQLLPLPSVAGYHPSLPPRSSSSDDDVQECISDENDEYRDRGQLEACSSLRNPHLRSTSVAANNYYNLTNHSPNLYLPEARGAFDTARTAPAGGRSFDSVTDCRWRARDDGEGSYLRPYVPDGGPRTDRAVYKSAYLWEDSSDNRRFTERRKKQVRFDGHEGAATFPRGGRDASGVPNDWSSLRWESERQTSQDSATKDSGIDTSSTFTSSEDSNRGECPKFPLSWQVSADGTRMVGHMVLRKSIVEGSSHSSSAILGLKVVGGKMLPDGTRGAIVEKVKKGSIADLEGQLRIGDEVLQWNGVPLQGRSAEDVAIVVANSKHDSHVELVVSRPLGPNRPVTSWRAHKEVYTEIMGGCEKPSVLVTSPGSPDVHSRRRSARHNQQNVSVTGRIQLKVSFDMPALQVMVTVVAATGLSPRADGSPRCPYAKIFLLPDKSEKSKRRTKTLANTLEPRWNQTFVYCQIRISDIKKRALEVTVWDLNRYGPNDFLGEVLLELDTVVHNEVEWYILKPHDEMASYNRYRDDDVDGEHLSPPSTSTSRLSDSDTPSECDLRRHHSLSSLASSSSPPPPHEIEGTRCSRRDMSPAGRVRTAGMARDRSGYVARSQSAAGGRSASPRRSLSPPNSVPRYAVGEERGDTRLPTHAYAPRFQSRSATATPTTSPKKRQLPQIPHQQSGQRGMRAQVSADLEERKWIAPHHIGATLTYRSTPQGWERHYAGLSDSELAARGGGWAPRRRLSPDTTAHDSDLESVASVTSSALSTQSERPRPTRMLSRVQTLPTYSTLSFCNSSPFVIDDHNDVSEFGTDSKTGDLLINNYYKITQKLHRTRPSRRQRRTFARSRSVGACPKVSYDTSSNYYDYLKPNFPFVRDNSLYNNSSYFSELKKYDNKISKLHTYNKTYAFKHHTKRKFQTYTNDSLQNKDECYNNTTDELNKIQSIFPNKDNIKIQYMRTLPDTPDFTNDDTIMNEVNHDSHIDDYHDYHHHYHGYASDDSIPETTIHISVDKRASFDIEPFKIHREVALSPKVLDTHNSFHYCPLNLELSNKQNYALNLRSSHKKNTQPDFLQHCPRDNEFGKLTKSKKSERICRSRSDSIVSIKYSPNNYTFIHSNEVNRNTKTAYATENFCQGPKTNLLQDDITSEYTSHNREVNNKNPNISNHRRVPNQRSLDTALKNSSCNADYAYTPTFPNTVTYHLFPNYGKMANSLYVGLSPTNLGSPCGLLTSDAPHLPPDDTHHKTTEATTYFHGDVDTAVADTKPDRLASNGEHNSINNNKSPKTTNKNPDVDINTNELESSNDYGGRENGRNHSQQQTLERGESRRGQFTRSLSNADVPPDEKADGSLSDTALGPNEIEPATDDALLKAEPRDYFGPGMGKKSNSTSQLSATGRKRRLGFGKRGKNSFTVQRSEEVVPGEMRGVPGVSRASSASSENDDDRWSPGMRGSGSSDGGGLSDFIDGLGPGQLIGRQLLGAPTLGDVQLSMCLQKGYLEVEVIRARGLQARQNSRTLPAPYVKVYLVNGKKCVAKAKTITARRTLDPLYQQTLSFRENLKNCILQVTVWGDYGRLEGKKVFMGVAQIMLDDLTLTNIVIGWYKLFSTTSL